MRRGESHAGVSCCPVHFILLCLAFLDLFKRCPTLMPYHQSMPLHRRLCCIHPHTPPALRITVSPLQFSLSAFSHSCPTPYPWSNARQILPANLLFNRAKLKRTSILEPPHVLKTPCKHDPCRIQTFPPSLKSQPPCSPRKRNKRQPPPLSPHLIPLPPPKGDTLQTAKAVDEL